MSSKEIIEQKADERLLSSVHLIYVLLSLAGILVGIGLYVGALHSKLAEDELRLNYIDVRLLEIEHTQDERFNFIAKELKEFRREYQKDTKEREQRIAEFYQKYDLKLK